MTEAYPPSVFFAFILACISWSIRDVTVQSHALPQTQGSSSMVTFSDGVYGVLRCGGGLLSSALARWYHCLPKWRIWEQGCCLSTRQGHPGCGSITSHKVILWCEPLVPWPCSSQSLRYWGINIFSLHLAISEFCYGRWSWLTQKEHLSCQVWNHFPCLPLTGMRWKWAPSPRLYPSTFPYFSPRSWCARAWLYFTALSHHLSLMKKQLTWVSGKTHRIIL